ncbi:hypothetical protein [Nitrososphaera sp. AFS]|uniref:hypothetical protein n=1 Tax=Nitrososphaera sp. AFS TaxID=2301191 RepID=UPI0013922776|nr:hypothetical protein [Nitrososphaera sp. AFS]NAL76850.1 hypothetical protein [Nitrososphaera sp. AFS]
MIGDHPESYSIYFACTCFIILSILLGAIQTNVAFSKALQPEMTAVFSNHFAKNNKSVETVMNEILDPSVFLSAAKGQNHNITNDNMTFNENSSVFPSFRNSATVLLSHQTLPPRDFITIYDSAPHTIAKGYLTAKLPCDSNFRSLALILVGETTSLKPASMIPIKQLSKPGYLCMYNTYLSSSEFVNEHGRAVAIDVVLFNPTFHRIVLLNTSTIILSIIEKLPSEANK